MIGSQRLWAGLVLVGLLSGSGFSQAPAPVMPAYGGVMQGNLAARFTTDDYLTRAYLINDLQYAAAYLMGSGNMTGTVKMLDLNWVGAWRMANPGSGTYEGIVQVAKGNVFGAGVGVIFDKLTTKDSTQETKTSFVPDGFSVLGSFNFGFGGLYGRVSLNTSPVNSVKAINSPVGGTSTTTENNSMTTSFLFGWIKDSEGEMSPAFGANVGVALGGNSQDSTAASPVKIDTSFMTLSVTASAGIPLKQTDDFAVFAGADLGFGLQTGTNKSTAATVENSMWMLNLRPNLCFQKQLGNGFEGLCGGAVNLVQWTNTSAKLSGGQPKTTSKFQLTAPDAAVGLRWVKDNFAIEGQLNSNIFNNGPYLISGTATANMFAAVGLAIGF